MDDKLPLFICLFVFISIAFIIFLIFGSFFLLQRLALKKQYKLMKRFNYFFDNPIASNLRPISFLVEQNTELKPLLDYFQNLNKDYTKQMEIIKDQIFQLSQKQKFFHVFKIWKYLKLIENNLSILNEEEKYFKETNLDTYPYINNTDQISIELSNIFSQLSSFLRDKNIEGKYNFNNNLKKTINEIEQITNNINHNLMNINVHNTHESFLNSFLSISKLFDLTKNYYYIYRYDVLIKTLHLNLKDTIKKNKQYINSQKIQKEIQREIKVIENKIKLRNNALKIDDFDTAMRIFSEEAIEYDKCNSNIINEVKFKKLLDTTFNNFKKLVADFLNKCNSSDLKNIYNKIENDFADCSEINKMIHECYDDIKKIFSDIENLKNQLAAKKIYSKTTIEAITNIYKEIIAFLDKNNHLKSILDEKNNIYFVTINAIDNYIIHLNYLLYIIKENNINNVELIHDIKQNLKLLNSHNNELKKTKLIKDDVKQVLNQVENFISEANKELSNNLMMKEIAERLLLYFNRYIKEEPENIARANQLISLSKHREAIELLINLSNKIKKGRKK